MRRARRASRHKRIILRHILPNIVAPYLIMVSASMAQAILLEASLSFLGLGVTEPTPAWGLMLSGTSADFYQTAPWMIVFPGVGDHVRRLRLQSVRRQLARLARSQAQELSGMALHAAATCSNGGNTRADAAAIARFVALAMGLQRCRAKLQMFNAFFTSNTSMMRAPLCGPSHTNCHLPSE